MDRVKVLIVEDEAIVAMLMRRNLKLLGYEICDLATTGDEAIAGVERHQPHVILMDIHLPGTMDGIEAAQVIRAHHAIPIIFVSGYSDASVLERAASVQPAAYLIKPVQTRSLAAAIDRAVADLA